MDHAPAFLDVAIHRAHHAFLFDLARYVIAASLISALVWALKRTSWKDRQIQPRRAKASDIRREVLASIRTILVYTVVSVFIIWSVRNGLIQAPQESFGWLGNLGMLAFILVMHDAYFYWTHRTMHHPKLFKRFHRFHHRTVTPTPWAAYSFAIPEAIVMAVFMPIWMFLVPTPSVVLFSFLAVMIVRNCMGHAGLELHARGWASHPLLKWISTTTHHDLHHSGNFNSNFGFYFTFWDKIMGTENPDYVATYDRVTARAPHPQVQVVHPSPTL
jgi:Delta7-sterol 5-desaturase